MLSRLYRGPSLTKQVVLTKQGYWILADGSIIPMQRFPRLILVPGCVL